MIKILMKIKLNMVQGMKMFFFSIILLMITTSCKNNQEELIRLINYSNDNLDLILRYEIVNQIEYIEMKTSDYPFLMEKGNGILNFNNSVISFLETNNTFNELKFINYRDSLNNHYNLNLKFEKIENCNDSIKNIILKNDILIVNYSINSEFIEKHCNIVD
jgi:hypothetical protein